MPLQYQTLGSHWYRNPSVLRGNHQPAASNTTSLQAPNRMENDASRIYRRVNRRTVSLNQQQTFFSLDTDGEIIEMQPPICQAQQSPTEPIAKILGCSFYQTHTNKLTMLHCTTRLNGENCCSLSKLLLAELHFEALKCILGNSQQHTIQPVRALFSRPQSIVRAIGNTTQINTQKTIWRATSKFSQTQKLQSWNLHIAEILRHVSSVLHDACINSRFIPSTLSYIDTSSWNLQHIWNSLHTTLYQGTWRIDLESYILGCFWNIYLTTRS